MVQGKKNTKNYEFKKDAPPVLQWVIVLVLAIAVLAFSGYLIYVDKTVPKNRYMMDIGPQ